MKLPLTNAPNPLHWTKNLCFRVFRNVSLLHESRRKTGRTGAINAQVRDMKLHWNFLYRTHPIHSNGPNANLSGYFWTVSLLHEIQCNMGETSAINTQVREMKLRRNFS
jgi:hypothetical protein